MQGHLLSAKVYGSMRVILGSIILIVDVIVWYNYASATLKAFVEQVFSGYNEKLIFNIVVFFAIIISMLTGSSLANKLHDRQSFFLKWTLLGVISSLWMTTLLRNAMMANILLLLLLLGVSFGLGLPSCMAIVADITKEENRAWFSSIIILSMFFGILVLRFVTFEDLFLNIISLTIWRSLGVIGVLLLRGHLKESQKRNGSIISIFKNRSLLLYLIPWAVFSLVNYLSWPICSKIYGEEFVQSSVLIYNNIIAGVFSLVAGFFADKIGRKRTLIGGFIIFGIGYAVLGITPFNVYAWYLYMAFDGIAWGIIYVIFLFTIWGDLAHERPSEKYYAVGIIPYALSGFLRTTLGPLIVNTVSEYAIFSFAAFFLFLAVVPLMYAPETLPDRVIKERELRGYIEKAKRIREKFTKGQ